MSGFLHLDDPRVCQGDASDLSSRHNPIPRKRILGARAVTAHAAIDQWGKNMEIGVRGFFLANENALLCHGNLPRLEAGSIQRQLSSDVIYLF